MNAFISAGKLVHLSLGNHLFIPGKQAICPWEIYNYFREIVNLSLENVNYFRGNHKFIHGKWFGSCPGRSQSISLWKPGHLPQTIYPWKIINLSMGN